MSYIKQYMQNARNFANESYLNADGFFEDNSSYFTANEDFYAADGMPMSAPAPMASVPTSQPYIVNVTNNNAVAYTNVDILGAYYYLQGTTMPSTPALTVSYTAAGSQTLTNGANTITVSSGISNVTYQQFLYQTMNSPFSVGLTYIQSATSTQIVQPLNLTTQDANGNSATKAIVVTIDPYQQQSGVVAVKQLYRIDGYTKLTISSLAASASVQFQFYPADNINIARGLSGRPASRQYANPRIVKESIAVVGGDTIQARLG